MNKLSQNFYKMMEEGYKTAKGITDVKEKALALAELAKAIAATGFVELSEEGIMEATDASTEKVETKKTETKKAATNTKKDSLKADAGKTTKAAEVKEEKDETPAPVEEITPEVEPETTADSTEVELDEECTDAMCELKAEALERLNQYTAENAWGEDYVYNQCVPAFFEDQTIVGGDHIRPTNIDGFVTYLDQIANSAE